MRSVREALIKLSMNEQSTKTPFSFSYILNVLPPLMAAPPCAAGGAEFIRVPLDVDK